MLLKLRTQDNTECEWCEQELQEGTRVYSNRTEMFCSATCGLKYQQLHRRPLTRTDHILLLCARETGLREAIAATGAL